MKLKYSDYMNSINCLKCNIKMTFMPKNDIIYCKSCNYRMRF